MSSSSPGKRVLVVLVCLALLGSAACSTSNKQSSPSAAFDATATANIARARTATAESRAASPEASPTTQPTPVVATATPTAGEATGSPAASPSAATGEIQQQLDNLEAQTADIRGLEPTTDVPETVIDRQQLRANLQDELEASYSPEQAQQDATELWLFRLVDDRSLDLYQLQLDLLTEQVLGYYDTDKHDLFVVATSADEGLSPLDQYTMSHEFTHALQDQHYDLNKLTPEDSDDDDRNEAATALIEGDAVLTSTSWALRYLSQSDLRDIVNSSSELSSSVLDSAPAYIQQQLLFPYDQGLNFVTTLYKQRQYDAIDAAFTDPPTSTEQIMHPEKYLAGSRDEPQDAALPDLSGALGAGWAQQESNTLGEFDLNVMLHVNGDDAADQDAAGWGGARYALYTQGDDAVVALSTVWDTQADADEFMAGLQATLPQALVTDNVREVDGRYIGFKEQGGSVYYVSGTDQAAVAAALKTLGG